MKTINFKISFLLAVTLLIISCTQSRVLNQDSYTLQTKELIHQILNDSVDCSCIIELPKTFIEHREEETPERNTRDELIRIFKIENSAIIDSMNIYSKSISLKDIIIDEGYEYVELEDWIKILKENGSNSGSEILNSMCAKGAAIITKPIFNATLTKAIIDINQINGWSSYPMPRVYKYTNGKWIVEEAN